jgi:hypothetical protein
MTKKYPRFLMVDEAVAKWHVTCQTVYDWMRRDLLVWDMVGGIRLIDWQESERRLA